MSFERRTTTREEAIAAAGDLAAEQHLARQAMTPREQAEAAWTPGGLPVDVLEDLIREERGLPAINRTPQGGETKRRHHGDA